MKSPRNSTSPINFGVYVAVGPGAQEVPRIRDLVESILAHEPATPFILFVDDSLEDRDLVGQLRLPPTCAAISIIHPRHGKGNGQFGPQFATNLISANWFAKNTNVEFVLKMDTDALVIGPFAERLSQLFARESGIGIVGVLGRTCNKSSREYHAFGEVETLMKNVLRMGPEIEDARWIEGQGGKIHIPGIGVWNRSMLQALAIIRRDLIVAVQHGYTLGQYIQGGAYAISPQLIRFLAQLYAERPLENWYELPFPEDVIMAVYCGVASLGLREQYEPFNVFGVQYKGLSSAPQEMLDSGYKLIHSLKNDPSYSESAIREFFMKARNG
jgi:hypothetical protein